MKKAVSVLTVLILVVSCFSAAAYAESEFKPYDNSSFFEYGDYDIHYRIQPAEGEYKGRIMMIHGFMCSTYAWRNMADILCGEGYECVMVDLPDFGYSTRENGDMEIVEREKIVIALMNSIAPGEEWILAGHSMGGGVAVNIAEMISVKALMLYCPCAQSEFPPAAEKAVKSGIMKAMMNGFFNYGTRLSFLVKLVIFAATNDWDFSMNYDVSGVTGPVQYDGFGAGICEMMYNVRATDLDSTDKIGCPVLLCQAEKDIILNNTQKQEMNEAFPSARTYLVENGGHQCIENRAEELCEVTTDFLNGVD